MLEKNPVGRPMLKSAPKIKVLISCFIEDKKTIKEFVKKMNDARLI
jgi:hypothetical protein